ncbi:MAG: S41 family peptidase [Lutisporaceae bacterium]
MKAKKLRRIIIISLLSALVMTITILGIYLYGIFNRTINSTVLKNADRNEKWLVDLKFVKTELPKKHKNLFFSKTESEFDKDMDLLISKATGYDDMKIKAELAKIINSVNDSHTSVDIYGSLIYPVSFFEFEEGIYLNNCSIEYKEFWGKKLVAVNGYSIEQLRLKLEPFISNDNQAIMKNEFCNSLKFVETLKIAGITKGNNAVFTFEDSKNADVDIKPLERENLSKAKLITELPEYADKFPIIKQKSDKDYWFEYIEQSDTVYVKYNSCLNNSDYSFSNFTKDVFNIIDSKKVKTLIIDFRDNGGGNSMIFSPFIREVKKRNNINTKDNLFVIIGRRTFSSAILNVMDLRNDTEATLIGEPTGGKPNHFGEVKMLHLSNVNIDIYYSSNYFKTTKDNTDSIYPDINIPLKAISYFNGEDDFLSYILSILVP